MHSLLLALQMIISVSWVMHAERGDLDRLPSGPRPTLEAVCKNTAELIPFYFSCETICDTSLTPSAHTHSSHHDTKISSHNSVWVL